MSYSETILSLICRCHIAAVAALASVATNAAHHVKFPLPLPLTSCRRCVASLLCRWTISAVAVITGGRQVKFVLCCWFHRVFSVPRSKSTVRKLAKSSPKVQKLASGAATTSRGISPGRIQVLKSSLGAAKAFRGRDPRAKLTEKLLQRCCFLSAAIVPLLGPLHCRPPFLPVSPSGVCTAVVEFPAVFFCN